MVYVLHMVSGVKAHVDESILEHPVLGAYFMILDELDPEDCECGPDYPEITNDEDVERVALNEVNTENKGEVKNAKH